MQHKYQYTGLQGAMKAQWMLVMFPELKLSIVKENILYEVCFILIKLNTDVETRINVLIDGHNEALNKRISIMKHEYDMDTIKIIVPPEMNSFFEEFTREDTIRTYHGEIDLRDEYTEVDLVKIKNQYERVKILKRRGIDFHMPERVEE